MIPEQEDGVFRVGVPKIWDHNWKTTEDNTIGYLRGDIFFVKDGVKTYSGFSNYQQKPHILVIPDSVEELYNAALSGVEIVVTRNKYVIDFINERNARNSASNRRWAPPKITICNYMVDKNNKIL